MKFTFGKVNSEGVKSCYLKRGEERIFVCWFDTSVDMKNHISPTQAVCQMIYKAGYNGLEDYWNTNKNKIIQK